MTNNVVTKRTDLPNNYWELNKSIARRDLIIKKIALVVIALINFAILGAVLYAIIAYCPLPAEALLVSPFIFGVLGALVYLKFPTLGVDQKNYSQFTNPTILLGKMLTYLFFGPYMFTLDYCDLTAYHDPYVANKISNDFRERSFEKLEEKYGDRFSNIIKYGIILPTFKDELLEIKKDYRPIKQDWSYYKEQGGGCKNYESKLKQQKADIERRWQELQEKMKCYPELSPPTYDFTSLSTRAWYQLHTIAPKFF